MRRNLSLSVLLKSLKQKKINELKRAEFRREQDTAKASADQAYDLETARNRQHVTEQEKCKSKSLSVRNKLN
ncbi:hypothetical protein BsIDN1_54080 [Bacillus safensis]|uniref:Uncharacterized protein n=1 Tax=Bacillus safensis TaxID=561879 RepID=A0A5S9ME62_BACIA|nr:hypothetical protein BsIDN1_54080 [Bacillus safensis]